MFNRVHLIGEVHLILQKERHILLLNRENTGFMDGYYHLPAGHKERDETVADAVIREAYEEIGIVIKKDSLQLKHVMYRKADYERIGFFFKAETWDGEVKNTEPHKCNHIKWFDVSSLPYNIVPYAKQAIICSCDDILYSEREANN